MIIAFLCLTMGLLKGASQMHQNMLYYVLRGAMKFFDTTPVGRILARFGQDVDVLDNKITTDVRTWMNCFFRVCNHPYLLIEFAANNSIVGMILLFRIYP